ncbi:MAG: hypothetical protein EP338_11400 [Bacteroidetes bacterium]|nr:MAG: hypothetical protein EP338_11400 [Bacteroidota bacterium]
MRTKRSLTLALILAPIIVVGQFNWTKVHDVQYPVGISFDQSDNLWMVNQSEISSVDGQGTVTDHSSNWISTNMVNLLLDHQGLIWGGGYGGMTAYDGSNYTNYSPDSLNGYSVYDTELNGQDLWLAMENEGATKYDGQSWVFYTANDGLKGDYFTSVSSDQNKKIWLTALIFNQAPVQNEAVINHFDGSTWTSYGKSDGIQMTEISCSFADSKGNVWVGGDALYRYDGSSWSKVNNFPDPFATKVGAIGEDMNGNVWISMFQGASYVFDGSNFVNANAPKTFSGRVDGFALSSQGTFHVCLEDGVYAVSDPSTSIVEKEIEGLSVCPIPNERQLDVRLELPVHKIPFSIVSSNGELVHTGFLNKGHNLISLAPCGEGVYYLHCGNLCQSFLIQGWE